jgi:euchromatic histone-lysine N-methyltransferase
MTEGSKKTHVNGSVTVKCSSGDKLENGAHAGAQKDGGEICMSEASKKSHVNGSAAVKSSSGEKLESGAHAVAQKDCGEICMPEGSKKSHVNGSGLKRSCSAADLVGEELEGTGNRAAKKINVAAKGCSSAGPVGNDNVSYCRKGRKEIVPWRFQIGYKRSFSTAFCSNGGSPETPEYRAQGSSTQCTSGTRSTVRCYASPHSGVRVSAVRNFSSGKGEKETRTAYKKMRSDNNDHNQGMPETGVSSARKTVMTNLQDFQLIYKKLLHELDKSKEALDLQAYKIFRDRFPVQYDDKRYVGNVPGVHVGDIFHVRVELCVVGLHRPHRIGIDHMKDANGTCIAVSIVAYARFSDIKKNLDALVYSGSTTATINQKIDGTNLALKKSMDTNTPVRVIHGFSTKGNGQRKMLIYGGLYLVEKYWRERESEDCYVYMFRLRRMAGQKHIDIEEILKSAHTEPYDGVIMKDISQGLERIPIPVVNSISDECPMPYVYMSRLKYPRNYQPAPPAGCACVGGCSASKRCACAAKNGGDIPFNDKGRIIVAKPLVYECGPSCKCPPTCHNRVGQKGMKFRLQIFKTKSMGWGVKTLDFIPSGSFVCEYIGEVLDDEEAQKRMTDEYLFAIGHNYYDEALWEGLSRSIPSLQKGPGEDEDAGFAVDASNMGNFAKFINHSCSPNLYAQNVLYDHDDKSAPHIMFFACEDIPPGQELAYHYNYAIDQVHDANGNIKKKKCLCGSVECDGWLY